MKKIIKLEGLCCANCAAKIEEGVKKLDGVNSASLSFMTQRLIMEVEDGSCEFMHVHEEIVKKVEGVMPDEQQLLDLSEFFKIFGDSTRIKILYVLSQSEMCVCDIATLLQMGQSAISHQLRVLKQMRLVSFRRDGKTVFYKLADAHIQTILAQGMEHISE